MVWRASSKKISWKKLLFRKFWVFAPQSPSSELLKCVFESPILALKSYLAKRDVLSLKCIEEGGSPNYDCFLKIIYYSTLHCTEAFTGIMGWRSGPFDWKVLQDSDLSAETASRNKQNIRKFKICSAAQMEKMYFTLVFSREFKDWHFQCTMCTFFTTMSLYLLWPCVRYNKKKGWMQGHI